MWTYPPEFLEALAGHGLAPTAATPPALLRAAVNDLYRHELRTARDRLRAGGIEKGEVSRGRRGAAPEVLVAVAAVTGVGENLRDAASVARRYPPRSGSQRRPVVSSRWISFG